MKTFIVFVDKVIYSNKRAFAGRTHTTRKQIEANDIVSASAKATAGGGIVSMIWEEWPRKRKI